MVVSRQTKIYKDKTSGRTLHIALGDETFKRLAFICETMGLKENDLLRNVIADYAFARAKELEKAS